MPIAAGDGPTGRPASRRRRSDRQPDAGPRHRRARPRQDIVRTTPTSIGAPLPSRARTRSASGQAASTRCSMSTIGRRSPSRASEPLEERRGATRIEVRRRLVEDQDSGPRREHAGQRQALLLPAREPVRAATLQATEPGVGDDLGHSLQHRGAWPAAILEAEGDVVLDALHDQLRAGILEDEPEPGGHDARTCRPGIDAVNGQLAGHGPRHVARDQSRERERQAALARSGRPDDEQAAAGWQLERDALNRRSCGTGILNGQVAGSNGPARFSAVRSRRQDQLGNPSRTPLRRSDRASRMDPPAVRRTAETTITIRRTTWTVGSTVG